MRMQQSFQHAVFFPQLFQLQREFIGREHFHPPLPVLIHG